MVLVFANGFVMEIDLTVLLNLSGYYPAENVLAPA